MSTTADRRKGAIPTRNKPDTITPPFQPIDEKTVAGGYPSLDPASGLVPVGQLGTGAADATKSLRGDQTWVATPSAADLTAETNARIAADNAEAATRLANDNAEVTQRAADDLLRLLKSANLSDLANIITARGNLGLGAVALLASIATGNLDNNAVTYAKMQDVSATDKVLGRSSAGAGDPEEIACTAAGRTILAAADANAQRTALTLSSTDTPSFLAIILGALSNAQFGMRTNGGFNLNNNTSVAWPATSEAGVGFLYDTNNSGAALFVWYNGASVAIVWQNGALFTTVAGSAGSTNVYYSGGSINVENKRGATAALRGFVWKVA